MIIESGASVPAFFIKAQERGTMCQGHEGKPRSTLFIKIANIITLPNDNAGQETSDHENPLWNVLSRPITKETCSHFTPLVLLYPDIQIA
jgi:hypothetical protein